MSKKIIFSCNFCRLDYTSAELIGVNWSDNKTLHATSPHAVENHICKTCLKAIIAMAPEAKDFK